jgi:CrcB protein
VRWLAVALAGAVGASTRYALAVAVGVRSFPWLTLGINVAGSFALAFLLVGPFSDRAPSPLTIGVTVGFLGAFTTFSTFSYEAVALARDDRLPAAAGYVAASTLLGLGAAALGYWLGRLHAS